MQRLFHSRARIASALIALIVTGGCSQVEEQHFYRVAHKGKLNDANYYRLTVLSRSIFSNTRYISGYFDESAVDAYFGEFAQPANGRFGVDQQANGTLNPSDTVAPASEKAEIVEMAATGTGKSSSLTETKSLEGRSYVMLLSTDPSAIANQIASFAEADQTATLIAKIANRGKLADVADSQADLTAQQATGSRLTAAGDAQIAGIADAATSDVAKASLLQWTNTVAASYGHTSPFKTLDEAKTWYDANRGRLAKE